MDESLKFECVEIVDILRNIGLSRQFQQSFMYTAFLISDSLANDKYRPAKKLAKKALTITNF